MHSPYKLEKPRRQAVASYLGGGGPGVIIGRFAVEEATHLSGCRYGNLLRTESRYNKPAFRPVKHDLDAIMVQFTIARTTLSLRVPLKKDGSFSFSVPELARESIQVRTHSDLYAIESLMERSQHYRVLAEGLRATSIHVPDNTLWREINLTLDTSEFDYQSYINSEVGRPVSCSHASALRMSKQRLEFFLRLWPEDQKDKLMKASYRYVCQNLQPPAGEGRTDLPSPQTCHRNFAVCMKLCDRRSREMDAPMMATCQRGCNDRQLRCLGR